MLVQALKAATSASLNWIRLIPLLKRLIDKFYEGDYENENVQVTENNNSSDKESDGKVSDFLSSDDSCNKWIHSVFLKA